MQILCATVQAHGAEGQVAEPTPARILITGANGFVGRHAVAALRQRFPQARLIGALQHPESAHPALDEILVMDLLDQASIDATIAASEPNAILHLAAQAAVGESFSAPLKTWQVNVMGTLALAETVLRLQPKARFLYVSSAEVYGLSFRAGRPLAEDASLAPANPYAASKAAADLAMGELALRGLHTIRLRPFNQIGPGQSEAFVVSAFARQIARIEAGLQNPVIRTGALDRWRDMLDVRDVVTAYAETIARADRLEPGMVINLASSKPRCIGDILSELMSLSAVKMDVETDPGRLRPTDIEKSHGDASRAALLLDWAPKMPWGTSLADILSDWRAKIA